MAKILIKHYLWLIDKLSKRPMTFSELSDSYEHSSLYDNGHPLQVRTLYNWREKIEELFNLQIKYENDTYKLKNLDSFGHNSPERWLLQSIAVSEVVERRRNIKSRILLEEIPSGDKYLADIIDAMEEGKRIRITYRRFSQPEGHVVELEPYCVKVNNRRWYVLGRLPGVPAPSNADRGLKKFGCLRIYALDRIQDLEITNKKFTYPEGFYPDEFFANHFGVCIGYDLPVERILVRIDGEQRQYIGTLPLHSSQRLVEEHGEYSIYEFRLHPTIDFFRAILSFGADAEVLYPLELRQLFMHEVEVINDFYHQPVPVPKTVKTAKKDKITKIAKNEKTKTAKAPKTVKKQGKKG